MKDLESLLKHSPSIETDKEKREATLRVARHAFTSRTKSKNKIIPFFLGSLSAAAAILFGLFLYPNSQDTVAGDQNKPLTAEMIVEAYRELRETFPNELSAIAVVDGEFLIFPSDQTWNTEEPIFVDMKFGNTRVQMVATQGASLPLKIGSKIHQIECLTDASGEPTILGENFIWSGNEKYMPLGHEILNASKVRVL